MEAVGEQVLAAVFDLLSLPGAWEMSGEPATHGGLDLGAKMRPSFLLCVWQLTFSLQITDTEIPSILYSAAFAFGTKSGMESVAHVSRSRWLGLGWTPTAASKMASRVHIPQTRVRYKAA